MRAACDASAARCPVGMKIYPTAEYESFPDCMHPQDAFPRYRMPGVAPEQVVRLGDTYLQVKQLQGPQPDANGNAFQDPP